MATIAEIRSGLVTNLSTVFGQRVYAYWPRRIAYPAAIVRPASGTFQAARVGNPITFEVTVATEPLVDIARAESQTDPYLDESGAQSVKAALDADRTLGGIVDTLNVSGWRDYDSIGVNGVDCLGVIIDVEVWP